MKISKILCILAISTIAACAHTENREIYQQATKSGFSFEAIDGQNYKAFYKGEKNQSKFSVKSSLVQNAAELTNALGYDYFYLSDENVAQQQFSDIGIVDGMGQLLAIFAVGLFNVKNYDSYNPYSTQLPYPKTHDVEAIEYEIFVASATIIMGKGTMPSGAIAAN